MNSFAKAKRIVIKLGTSTLTHDGGLFNYRRIDKLVKVISDLKNSGREIVVVSSGAIAVGTGKLGLSRRPSDIPTKQACAAIGQCELMYMYDKQFSEYNHLIAQILITMDVVDQEERKQNAINTFNRLLELGVIPIVNENDTVATEEIVIGDNDTLSAIVSVLISADVLVLMSDIDGLYTSNPKVDEKAELIPVVRDIDSVMDLAQESHNEFARGGMITKLHAAKTCRAANIDMAIVNGSNPDILYDLFDGRQVGTHFIGG